MFLRFERVGSSPLVERTIECNQYDVKLSKSCREKRIIIDDGPVQMLLQEGEGCWNRAYVMNSDGHTIDTILAPSLPPSVSRTARRRCMMSSNPHRGDTPVTVGDDSFVLCYDLNACALIMEKLGLSNFEQLAEMGQREGGVGLSEIRYLLWAGLQRHHPKFSENDVGAMEWDLEEVGPVLGGAFQKGLLRRTPPDVEKKVTRKSRTGTGRQSKSEPTKPESSAQTSSGD